MAKKDKGVLRGNPVTYQTLSPADGVILETFIPWMLVKRGVRRQIITPLDAPEEFQEEAATQGRDRKVVQDNPLVKALGLAHYWQSLLEAGKSANPSDIARKEDIEVTRVREILRLTLLAPDIVEMCISSESNNLTLEHLLRESIPKDWNMQQTKLFGL